MYRQQNHQRQARPWAYSNHRSPVYKTGALTTILQSHVTELSSNTLPYMVMVKKPKETMTIKSMHNVPRAKNSKIIEALGGFEPPISCLQDKRITTMLESRNKERKQK